MSLPEIVRLRGWVDSYCFGMTNLGPMAWDDEEPPRRFWFLKDLEALASEGDTDGSFGRLRQALWETYYAPEDDCDRWWAEDLALCRMRCRVYESDEGLG